MRHFLLGLVTAAMAILPSAAFGTDGSSPTPSVSASKSAFTADATTAVKDSEHGSAKSAAQPSGGRWVTVPACGIGGAATCAGSAAAGSIWARP